MHGPECFTTVGMRIASRFLAFLIAIGALLANDALAQDFERYHPQPLPVETPPSLQLEQPLPPVTGSDQILLPQLEAIVVLDRADKIVVEGSQRHSGPRTGAGNAFRSQS